jgi:tetratricopeptide (TPR) repeat protein
LPGTAIPARFALERRQWKDAAALSLQPAKFPWERFPFAEANVYFARAVGAARSGDQAAARLALQRLVSIQAALGGARGGYDWAKQVEIQQVSAAAWLAQAEGNSADAERLLRASAELEDSTDKHPVTPGAILPAREMLGDLMLEQKRPTQAITQYEVVLRTAPNRFNSLYGAARAAELVGNRQKARLYYRKLTALSTRATGGRAELELAKRYLAKK